MLARRKQEIYMFNKIPTPEVSQLALTSLQPKRYIANVITRTS
jgi:hypothetical protein